MLSSMTPTGPQHDLWAMASWTYEVYDGWHGAKMPTGTLVNPLFSPLDPGGDPLIGGLGLVPAHFFWQNFPQPYDANAANEKYSYYTTCVFQH